MRIDRADDGGERPGAPAASEARGADAAYDAEPMRAAAAEPAGTGQGDSRGDDASAARVARNLEYRATVDAANRAHAIDQGYTRLQEIEEKTMSSREEPVSVLRRVEHEGGERDEQFGRDLQWTRSPLLFSHARRWRQRALRNQRSRGGPDR